MSGLADPPRLAAPEFSGHRRAKAAHVSFLAASNSGGDEGGAEACFRYIPLTCGTQPSTPESPPPPSHPCPQACCFPAPESLNNALKIITMTEKSTRQKGRSETQPLQLKILNWVNITSAAAATLIPSRVLTILSLSSCTCAPPLPPLSLFFLSLSLSLRREPQVGFGVLAVAAQRRGAAKRGGTAERRRFEAQWAFFESLGNG